MRQPSVLNIKSFRYVPDKKQINTIKTNPISQEKLKSYISKADTNNVGSLFCSITSKDLEMTKTLLANPDSDPFKVYGSYNKSPFVMACSHNDPNFVRAILQQHPTARFETLLEGAKVAAGDGYLKTAEYLIGQIKLRYPYNIDDQKVIDLFLSACMSGNAALLDKVREINPSAFNNFKYPDSSAKVDLHAFMNTAIRSGNHHAVKYLLDNFKGIDINAALSYAATRGELNCLNALLKKASKVDPQKLLDDAVDAKQKQITQYVINHFGIKPTFDNMKASIKNKDNETLYILLQQYKSDTETVDNKSDLADINLLKNTLAGDEQALKSLIAKHDDEFAADLLMTGVYSRNVALVNNLVKMNITIDTGRAQAVDALIVACEEKDAVSASLLIKAGVNPFDIIIKREYGGLAPIDIRSSDLEFTVKLLKVCNSIPDDYLTSYSGSRFLADLCYNNAKSLDELLTAHPKFMEKLNDQTPANSKLIENLFEKGNMDSINVLVKHGLKLPNELEQRRVNHLNDTSQLSKQPNSNPDQVVLDAVYKGDINLITQLHKEKKLPSTIKGNSVMDLAAVCGHKQIVSLFVESMSKNDIKIKLLDALNKRQLLVISGILESLPAEGVLSEHDLRLFEPYKAEINQAHQRLFYKTNNKNELREDTKDRLKDIDEDKNALAKFLHLPAKATISLKKAS